MRKASLASASKAKDLNIKGLRKALGKIDEALGKFCRNDLLYLTMKVKCERCLTKLSYNVIRIKCQVDNQHALWVLFDKSVHSF